jgi:hypothetical protein
LIGQGATNISHGNEIGESTSSHEIDNKQGAHVPDGLSSSAVTTNDYNRGDVAHIRPFPFLFLVDAS